MFFHSNSKLSSTHYQILSTAASLYSSHQDLSSNQKSELLNHTHQAWMSFLLARLQRMPVCHHDLSFISFSCYYYAAAHIVARLCYTRLIHQFSRLAYTLSNFASFFGQLYFLTVWTDRLKPLMHHRARLANPLIWLIYWPLWCKHLLMANDV